MKLTEDLIPINSQKFKMFRVVKLNVFGCRSVLKMKEALKFSYENCT